MNKNDSLALLTNTACKHNARTQGHTRTRTTPHAVRPMVSHYSDLQVVATRQIRARVTAKAKKEDDC